MFNCLQPTRTTCFNTEEICISPRSVILRTDQFPNTYNQLQTHCVVCEV